MTERSDLPMASDGAAAAAAALDLAPPPLIEGENAAAYDDLLARISGTLKPADVLEEIWVRDVVDLAWEVFRLRRLKAHLMRAGAYEGMAQVLKPLVEWRQNDTLAEKWSARDREAVATVDTKLAAAGLTMDAVMARMLSARVNDVERIERMMMAAEGRRDSILRELEGRRAALAHNLRHAIREVEEAEFKVIPLDRSGDAA